MVMFLLSRRTDRMLWTADGGYPSGRIIFSPDGEIVVSHGQTIRLIDPSGKSRLLCEDRANLMPIASAGKQGFVAVRYAIGSSETSLIDWDGKEQWTFPMAALDAQVTSGGMIYFFGSDTNFYALRPDGSVGWKIPVETKSPWLQMAVGHDESVVLSTGASDRLMALEKDGSVRWIAEPTEGGKLGEIVRDSEGGLIIAGSDRLRSLSPQGKERWRISFPLDIPTQDGSKRMISRARGIFGLAVDRRSNIYCHSYDGLVYVLDEQGKYRWSYPRGNAGFGPNWIAFTESGDAIFGTGEYRHIASVATPGPAGGRFLSPSAEFNRHLVCLSPDGQLRWEVAVAGELNWFWPKSKIDMNYLWAARFGLAELNPVRSPFVGTNGVIYFARNAFNRGTAKIYAIRGDEPKH